MEERLINVEEIKKFCNNIEVVKEEIDKNFRDYESYLEELFNNGIIEGRKEVVLTDAYYYMEDKKKDFTRVLDNYINYLNVNVINKNEELDELGRKNLKEILNNLMMENNK